MDYFELFGLEPKYNLDKNKLNKQYLLKQMKIHASDEQDSNKDNNVKALDLNKAFKILDDDYSRAKYMLQQVGTKITEKNSKNALSPDDLNEVLHQLEVIEEMDQLSSLQNVKQIKEQEKINLVMKIDKALRIGENEEAKLYAIKLKYLDRVIENLNVKIKQLVV